jgi:hypothetical protein
VAGQFSGWVPIGAEATSSGYDVAWKNTATGLYTVWSTDSNGNFTSNLLRNLSGKNTSLESIETLFKQDLNRDGMIGVPTTIEAFGSTSMVQVGSNYFLGQNGLALKYGGVAYVAGQFSGWVPIGAEATSSGYDVAWKNTATGLYTVWSTDSNGNFTSNILSNVSQTDASLKSIETSFHQDLNGDGVIGILATPIEAFGSTKLDQVANNYYLDSGSAGSGPLLKYAGAAVVAGQFYPWTPIAVEATAGGYEVAWKLPGTDQYTIWNTDSSGNYLSSPYGNLSGSSTTFKSLESSFQQDLNGDGVIAIAAGQTMELTGASSGVITFAGATGTLKIDHSASFSDPIGGQLAIGDVIDLADITAGANATIGYSGKNSPGTLTVSDGTHTASIALLGNYSLANFTASSDGKGGTSVIDPPLSTDQSGYLPSKQLGVDSVAWLSALDTRLALWSQQMASSFPSSSFDGLGSKLDNSEFGASGLGVQLATPTANSKYLSSLQG